MKNEVKQSISSKSPGISKMSMKKERLPRKGSLANFKGWKPLYQDLKKRKMKKKCGSNLRKFRNLEFHSSQNV